MTIICCHFLREKCRLNTQLKTKHLQDNDGIIFFDCCPFTQESRLIFVKVVAPLVPRRHEDVEDPQSSTFTVRKMKFWAIIGQPETLWDNYEIMFFDCSFSLEGLITRKWSKHMVWTWSYYAGPLDIKTGLVVVCAYYTFSLRSYNHSWSPKINMSIFIGVFRTNYAVFYWIFLAPRTIILQCVALARNFLLGTVF